jgi:hypothetical protein
MKKVYNIMWKRWGSLLEEIKVLERDILNNAQDRIL